MANKEGPIYWLRKKSVELGTITQKWTLRGALISAAALMAGIPGASQALVFTGGWYAGDKVQDFVVDPKGDIQKEVYGAKGEKPGFLEDLKRASGIGKLRFWRPNSSSSMTSGYSSEPISIASHPRYKYHSPNISELPVAA